MGGFIEPAFGQTQWSTADGRNYLIKDMDAQHLSNIYYFLQANPAYGFWRNDKTALVTVQKFRYYITRKFGDILPYKPVYDWEIEMLRKEGVLKPGGELVLNGERVGYLAEQSANYELYRDPFAEAREAVDKLAEAFFVKIESRFSGTDQEIAQLRQDVKAFAQNIYANGPSNGPVG